MTMCICLDMSMYLMVIILYCTIHQILPTLKVLYWIQAFISNIHKTFTLQILMYIPRPSNLTKKRYENIFSPNMRRLPALHWKTEMQRKSMDWFLYDKDLRHELVKELIKFIY